MARVSLALLVGLSQLAVLPGTMQQDTSSSTPLNKKHFPWPNLPYRADTGDGPRGTQQGYNICNSTTQNQDSMCQTTILNSINEFCLWGAQKPNSVVGDVEGEMVAYCTAKKFGARILPASAITGVQFTQTPGYVQVVGFIDQTALNLQASDAGGEEDSEAADSRGNPLGALMYSNAFGGNRSSYTQVSYWSYFIGGGIFCYKACDPAGPNAPQLCEHIYDRIGCAYNAPAHYDTINGTFTSCQGDNQLPAGQYVENGVTKTYTQPDEKLGPITSIPYTAAIPAVRNCQTFNDTRSLWPDLSGGNASAAANTSSSSSQKSSSSSLGSGSTNKTGHSGTTSSASGFRLSMLLSALPMAVIMMLNLLA